MRVRSPSTAAAAAATSKRIDSIKSGDGAIAVAVGGVELPAGTSAPAGASTSREVAASRSASLMTLSLLLLSPTSPCSLPCSLRAPEWCPHSSSAPITLTTGSEEAEDAAAAAAGGGGSGECSSSAADGVSAD